MAKKVKSITQTPTKTSKKKKSKSKSKTKSKVLAPVPVENTVEANVEATPVVVKVETTPVVTKTETTPATELSEELTSGTTQVVQEVKVPTLSGQLATLCDDWKAWQSSGRDLWKRTNDCRKDCVKLEKALDKALHSKKHTRKRNSNHKSGIMQPHKVSKKLEKFMTYVLEDGDTKEIYSRVDVLTAISKYVKKKALQDVDNSRFINLDKHLLAIFPNLKGCEGTERLQFTSVMRNIGQHFPPPLNKKKPKAVTPVETVTTDSGESAV